MKTYAPICIAVIGIFLCLPATAADLTAGGSNDVIQWNNAALQAIRDTKPGPPIAARDLAILQTSIFDAWAAYDPKAKGTQEGGTLRRPTTEDTLANKNQAISYAAYRTMVDLFPSQVTKFNNLMTTLGYNPTDTSVDITTPTGIGNVAASSLLNFRHNDGSNQLGNLSTSGIPYSDYTGYKPVNTPDAINNPDLWQPLRVPKAGGGSVVQSYLAPFWGNVTPFALSSGSQLRPIIGPKTLESDPVGFKQQAQDILNLTANLTDKQKAQAQYWADGPNSELPPGHWNLFAQYVSQRDKHTLDDDVKMFFALDNALLDSSIAAWDAKQTYNSVRPITAIHYLFKDQLVPEWNGLMVLGQNWLPYQPATVVTPAFPEFVSGHSTYSAAAAEILSSFTGSDVFGYSYTEKAGTSIIDGGPATDVSLSWDTFSAAADEAGMSRRYGGIHFADGDLAGRAMGREVGSLAWSKALNYINGTSIPEPDYTLGLLALGGEVAFQRGARFYLRSRGSTKYAR